MVLAVVVVSRKWEDILLSPKHLHELRRKPSLLFDGYRFPFRGQIRWDLLLTTYLQLLPRLRMSGAVSQLPLQNKPSCVQGQICPNIYYINSINFITNIVKISKER